jgi:hypothetical protein
MTSYQNGEPMLTGNDLLQAVKNLRTPEEQAKLEKKNQMLVEALEFYIYDMVKNNCNTVAIEAFTELKNEIEEQI